MISDKLISIIIPNYNDGDKILRCLNSIFHQVNNYNSVEIIVVDDGSTDNSIEILRRLGDRIKLVIQNNKGAGAARTAGLNVAQGKYIWFIDADDEIAENSLNDSFLNLLATKNYDAYLFGIKEIKPNGRIKIFNNTKNMILESKKQVAQNFEYIFSENTLNEQCNKIYNKAFLIKNNIRFYPFSIGEDAVWNYQVFMNLNNLMVLNEVKYIYYLFTSSSSQFNKSRNIVVDTKRRLKLADELYCSMGISLNNSMRSGDISSSMINIFNSYFQNNNRYEKFKLFVKKNEISKLQDEIDLSKLTGKEKIKGVITKSVILSYVYFKLKNIR